MGFYLIWAASAVTCVLAIVAVRSWRLRRFARPSDLRWRGVVVLSLLAGITPALAYSFSTRTEVEVPPEILQHLGVPGEPSGPSSAR